MPLARREKHAGQRLAASALVFPVVRADENINDIYAAAAKLLAHPSVEFVNRLRSTTPRPMPAWLLRMMNSKPSRARHSRAAIVSGIRRKSSFRQMYSPRAPCD